MADFFFLAPEIVLPFRPLSSEQFNKIRSAAEKSWKNETQWSERCLTTYGAHYRSKKVDEPPRIQPFNETRLNNPHPHELFLVNKIHYLPGYYNSKAREPERKKGEGLQDLGWTICGKTEQKIPKDEKEWMDPNQNCGASSQKFKISLKTEVVPSL
ncbi:uncharacterized protein C4orf51 homolog isoform X4 [Sminthopsis crassicaudata]|uniref:uncharacterized protein C4orf51 homolog isoform X4 n=1 Tax=Sminthopsis crassicaudata TaxID=9301 RepID=UPI003D6957FF